MKKSLAEFAFKSAQLSAIQNRVQADHPVNAAHHWLGIVKDEMTLLRHTDKNEDDEATDIYASHDGFVHAIARDPEDSLWVHVMWVDIRTREMFSLNAHALVDGDDVPVAEAMKFDGSGYEQNLYDALKLA